MATLAAEFGSTANRYQILGRIAVGGMAEIYLARAAGVAGVERYCVLKRILRERANDAQFVQMFIDEARLAAQLQHPNIASVYDIGMLGDSYFFTMEYVHGETVRSLVQRAQGLRRPLPLACVLTIIAGTASGLHHAHERNGNDGRPLGIVHRDISPSNLMVSYEGNVKIVDFGVAKADDRMVKTQSGTVKGKISYLSPEQCRGTRVDRRSDLFSLGIVMWEMLTGARLYRRASDFDNMAAIVHEQPPPPSARRSEVPRELDDLVLRLLAKSVTDRFQTARDVVEAIENAALRAGTILSTSAVSQLARDLFGARAEPWLEYESETLPLQPSMIASRPLPKELGHTLPDPVERELAAVPDLAISGMFEEVITDESISSIDVETLEPPARAPARPAPRNTVPASPAARLLAPRAADAVARVDAGRSPAPAPAPLHPSPPLAAPPSRPSRPGGIAPLPGVAPAGVAPVAAQGSQPVHVADLAPRTEPARAPAMLLPSRAAADTIPLRSPPRPDPGLATLREVPPPPLQPTALPSATTLRTAAAPNAIAGLPVTVLAVSPAGAAGPAATSPAAMTIRDATALPALIGPHAATLVPASPAPWPPINATPPAPFEALRPAESAHAPGSPGGVPHPRPAAPPSPPMPRATTGDAPGVSSVSSVTTAKWRPTRELALRVAPRLFTVIIPAAMIGAILAWVLTREKPPATHITAPAPTGSSETMDEGTAGAAVAAAPDAGAAAESAPAAAPPPAQPGDVPAAPGDVAGAPAPGVIPGDAAAASDPALDASSAPSSAGAGSSAAKQEPSDDDPPIVPAPSSGGSPPAAESRRTAPPAPGSDADGRPPGPSLPPRPSADRPPPRTATPSAPATGSPGSNDSSLVTKALQIESMWKQKDYARALRACHAVADKALVALVAADCFDTACREHNLSEARYWLAKNPPANRQRLTASCKSAGLDLKPPTLDCTKYALDCR